jgi:hypothetical protein
MSTLAPSGRARAQSEEMKIAKPPARPWTSDEVAQLGHMLDAGKQPAEIAVALSRTRQAIYARLQKLYRKRARDLRGTR